MRIETLDHVNIVTDDLQGTARFYAEMFELEIRDGPAPLRPDQVRWAYDGEGRAIVHINSKDFRQAYEREAGPAPTTGAVHHVAFRCVGHDETAQRLQARGIPYTQNTVQGINLRQIFAVDPNGVLLELNFFGD